MYDWVCVWVCACFNIKQIFFNRVYRQYIQSLNTKYHIKRCEPFATFRWTSGHRKLQQYLNYKLGGNLVPFSFVVFYRNVKYSLSISSRNLWKCDKFTWAWNERQWFWVVTIERNKVTTFSFNKLSPTKDMQYLNVTKRFGKVIDYIENLTATIWFHIRI